jgi:hypothetical protein
MIMRSSVLRTDKLAAVAVLLVLCIAVTCTGCGKIKEKRAASKEPAPHMGEEWLDGITTAIQDNVHDPSRAGKMLEIVKEIAVDLREIDEIVKKYYADIDALNADYHSTPDDFRKLTEEFNTKTQVFRSKFLDNRFKLKDLATPEEWKKITDQDKYLMEVWQRQPGAKDD